MSTPAPEVFVTALANAGSSIHVSEVQTRRRRPSDVLDEMLTRVSHLDLSGKVTKLDAHLKSGGSYADIYLGCLNPDGQVVAIRQLRSHIFQEASELKKSIAYELRIWSNLHHPNVLPLKGYTLDFGQYPAFITEWMANGTVLEFVKCTPEADYLRLSIGIAAGLNYLHVNGIVHADMKSSNVVVSPQGEPLLIDFGLSRILDISRVIMTTREASGTFRWMAFELCGGGRDDSECGAIFATRASDIWAYGMIVLELLSKEYPYSHLRADFQVYTAIHNGQLPPKPQGLSTALDLALWTLCNRCWLLNPSLRPSASDILYSLTLLENTDLMGHVPQSDILPCQDHSAAQPSSPDGTARDGFLSAQTRKSCSPVISEQIPIVFAPSHLSETADTAAKESPYPLNAIGKLRFLTLRTLWRARLTNSFGFTTNVKTRIHIAQGLFGRMIVKSYHVVLGFTSGVLLYFIKHPEMTVEDTAATSSSPASFVSEAANLSSKQASQSSPEIVTAVSAEESSRPKSVIFSVFHTGLPRGSWSDFCPSLYSAFDSNTFYLHHLHLWCLSPSANQGDCHPVCVDVSLTQPPPAGWDQENGNESHDTAQECFGTNVATSDIPTEEVDRKSENLVIRLKASSQSPFISSDLSNFRSRSEPSRPVLGKPLKSSLKSTPSLPATKLRVRARSISGMTMDGMEKNVHFGETLESVRLFAKSSKPMSVSSSASTEGESEEDDDEDFNGRTPFPMPPPAIVFEVDPNCTSPVPSKNPPEFGSVRLETLVLPWSGPPALKGTVIVRNIAPEKVVAVRFTTDYWKTTSEVSCRYVDSLVALPSPFRSLESDILPGSWDRFSFVIKLEDFRRLSKITLCLAIRYAVGGGEWWDNNSSENYRIGFRAVNEAPRNTWPVANDSDLSHQIFHAYNEQTPFLPSSAQS